MQELKNARLLLLLVYFFYLCPYLVHPINVSSCGEIQIQTPFSIQDSVRSSSPLSKTLLCKSQKLYFRTSLGLLEVSSVDYKAKTLTISHTECSSSLHFISPSILSAGLPSPPQANTLLLYNCLSQIEPMSPVRNCSSCKALSKKQDQPSSCWIVHDLEKLEKGFDPKDLNCSHYTRVYRDFDSASFDEGLKLGTIVSFDIPDHIPNMCDECAKSHGNCGVGLRCICHPKDCRDKVISSGAPIGPGGDNFISLLIFTVVINSLIGR